MTDDKEKFERQKIFGENLERIRKERGKSRKELAAALGIIENSLGAYCTGRSFPSVDKLLKLAVLLDCSVADLIGDNPNATGQDIFQYRLKRALEIIVAAGFDFPELQNGKPIEIKSKTQDIFKTDNGIRLDVPLESLKFENLQNFVAVIEAIEVKAVTENRTFKETIQKLIDSQF